MKITFDNDHDAQVFWESFCWPLQAAAGAMAGTVHGPFLAKLSEALAVQYFDHRGLRQEQAARQPLKASVNQVVTMLLLVDPIDDVAAIESRVKEWTHEEREAAMDWAGAVHLAASDNDDVKVPPIPLHVVPTQKTEYRPPAESTKPSHARRRMRRTVAEGGTGSPSAD